MDAAQCLLPGMAPQVSQLDLRQEPLLGHPIYELVGDVSPSGGQGPRTGSFSQVARTRDTGELVQVKFVPRGWDEGTSEACERGAVNHMELSMSCHPHIVEFKAAFLTPHYLALVTEYIEGETIETFLEKIGGKVIEGLARFIGQQLLITVDYSHRCHKVLRDIKLSNTLLVMVEGQLPMLKLGDFCCSRDVLRDTGPLPQTGSVLYAAPEVLQNLNGGVYDPKAADVWAVGIILYVMLFGRHPFLRDEDAALSQEQRMLAVLQRTIRGDAEYPDAIASGLSPPCMDLLRGMLHQDPTQRITMDRILAHPWFLEALPGGAAGMNDVFLAHCRGLVPAEAQQFRAMVRKAAVDDGDCTVPSMPPVPSVLPVPLVPSGRPCSVDSAPQPGWHAGQDQPETSQHAGQDAPGLHQQASSQGDGQRQEKERRGEGQGWGRRGQGMPHAPAADGVPGGGAGAGVGAGQQHEAGAGEASSTQGAGSSTPSSSRDSATTVPPASTAAWPGQATAATPTAPFTAGHAAGASPSPSGFRAQVAVHGGGAAASPPTIGALNAPVQGWAAQAGTALAPVTMAPGPATMVTTSCSGLVQHLPAYQPSFGPVECALQQLQHQQHQQQQPGAWPGAAQQGSDDARPRAQLQLASVCLPDLDLLQQLDEDAIMRIPSSKLLPPPPGDTFAAAAPGPEVRASPVAPPRIQSALERDLMASSSFLREFAHAQLMGMVCSDGSDLGSLAIVMADRAGLRNAFSYDSSVDLNVCAMSEDFDWREFNDMFSRVYSNEGGQQCSLFELNLADAAASGALVASATAAGAAGMAAGAVGPFTGPGLTSASVARSLGQSAPLTAAAMDAAASFAEMLGSEDADGLLRPSSLVSPQRSTWALICQDIELYRSTAAAAAAPSASFLAGGDDGLALTHGGTRAAAHAASVMGAGTQISCVGGSGSSQGAGAPLHAGSKGSSSKGYTLLRHGNGLPLLHLCKEVSATFTDAAADAAAYVQSRLSRLAP